ncbi:MAG: hypothetical protein WCQ21_09615 [Verrucomicrobiota bacterium]|jgi:hypothetical protein
MRNTIAIAALSVLCSGCTTDIVNQFRGEARNMRRDGRSETLQCDIPGYCSGPSAAGGQFVGFGLPTQGFSIFLFYPKLAPTQSLATNTSPPSVDAWLVRSNAYPWSDASKCENPEELRLLGGERLAGRVAVRWKSNADFLIAVDLAATNGAPATIDGEFVGYTHTKFDPAAPLVGLSMLFFGEGHSSAAAKPVEANKPQ